LRLDVPSRVAAHLLHLALSSGTRSPDGVEVVLDRSKADIAAAVGTVPETLSRALAKLAEESIIKVDGQKITVLDVRSLAERGSGWTKS
ncbi:MAG: helix-turn-helix domain-containing protein, partial [Actinobacteria bacterium]|nr:helix-turn-helix domain-containing protein [Actinomycetota bacterium]